MGCSVVAAFSPTLSPSSQAEKRYNTGGEAVADVLHKCGCYSKRAKVAAIPSIYPGD